MMMRLIPLFLFAAAVGGAAEMTAPKPQASPLDGLADAAKSSEEAGQAALDGGSTIGFIPVTSQTAARSLNQYLQGFFRDDDSKGPVEVPKKAQQVVQLLPALQAAGASHLIAISHDAGGEAEYVRFLAIGAFTTASVAKLESSGLAKLGADGALEIVAFKDAEEIPAGTRLPPLPIGRLTQMAKQLASEGDCSVDIVLLASKDALSSYDEALKEAFVEDGQPIEKAEVPARARQLATAFPSLKTIGASHVIVTAFQNLRGADIVLVVAKGQFTEEAQAKAKSSLSLRLATESTLVLGRWVDGEEKGAAETPPASGTKTERPTFERRKGFGKK
jgi:hypothetical protein